jgi:hypothetical protein
VTLSAARGFLSRGGTVHASMGNRQDAHTFNSIFSIMLIRIILLLNSAMFDILTRQQPGGSQK